MSNRPIDEVLRHDEQIRAAEGSGSRTLQVDTELNLLVTKPWKLALRARPSTASFTSKGSRGYDVRHVLVSS
jgi:hypothetical protein